ncbi:MAG: hypothetical protein BSOLF_2854 [Candidatus Carbobacillus altaicus]|uniref:Uncharacterized protein n=1 Tax=Candidatus Carbonibacillus altaicus TaxID=2163959 RepID=A0A2R6XXS9_9BACL|nr:MAG: hypothetical protein BSOLF_2854 [Candidatus Carbobacillus altaicus]
MTAGIFYENDCNESALKKFTYLSQLIQTIKNQHSKRFPDFIHIQKNEKRAKKGVDFRKSSY